jgi:3-hydroxyisobutyrate dehydrogenase
MAGNLRKRPGSDIILHIYDIALAVSHRLVDEFGSYGKIEVSESPLGLANKCKTAISSLPMGKHVRDVYTTGDYCVLKAEKNTDHLIIDCSTIEIEFTRDMCNTIIDAGVGTFVDATVSGGVRGATHATLTFMVGHARTAKIDVMGNCVRDLLSIVG